MKRLLTTTTLAALLAAAALPAHAAPTRDFAGGCGYDTVNQDLVTGPDRFTGVIWAYVAATDDRSIPLPTSSISVDCEIYVNGVLADVALSASGIGAAAGVATYSFVAAPEDTVELCDRVVVDGEEIFRCYSGYGNYPPEGWPPIFYDAIDILNAVIDDVACPLLGSLAPGVPGVVDITPEGDIALAGVPFFDCPPYQETT